MMQSVRKFQTVFMIRVIAIVLMAIMVSSSARADKDEQDQARAAMLSGDVAPLSQLLAIVDRTYQGDIIKVEMEHEDARKWGRPGTGKIFIYEIKVLTLEGNLIKLKYDAKSLELLAVNGRGEPRKKDDHKDRKDGHKDGEGGHD